MSTPATQMVKSFPQMLTEFLPEIKRALPKHMDGDRMARIALTEFRKNPKLGDCDPKSIFASIIIGSQLGLEPGIMGQAFLVPYKRTCQFIPGWQGINDLVTRAGRATAWTGAVREGDEFDYALGDRPFIRHKPNADGDESPLIYVYAVGRVRDADWPIIEVWSLKKIIRHRDKYNKVGEQHYSFKNIEMYARKVPLLQVIKYLPKSVELTTAVALDHAANQGEQGLTIEGAIEGTWTPMPDAETAVEVQKPRAKSESVASAGVTAPPKTGSVEVATNQPPIKVGDDPIGPNLIPLIQAKMAAATITENELFKHFKVNKFEDLTTSKLDDIFAWIKNPC